jgi:hypothetical protein
MFQKEAFLLVHEWRQRIEREEACFVDLGARSRRAAMRTAAKPDVETLRFGSRSNFHDFDDLDDEAGLLAYLSFERARR